MEIQSSAQLNTQEEISSAISKETLNAFNQSVNLLYDFSLRDVEAISQQLFAMSSRKDLTFLGVLHCHSLQHAMQRSLSSPKDGLPAIAILRHESEWAVLELSWNRFQEKVVLQCSSPDEGPAQLFTALLSALGPDQTATHTALKQLNPQIQHSAAIYALKNFEAVLTQSRAAYDPPSLQMVLNDRKILSEIYLKAERERLNAAKWTELDYEQKKTLILALRPLTREQFTKTTKVEGRFIDFEVNALLREAFDRLDSALVKAVYRAEVGPSFIKNARSEVVTVPVLIAKAREDRPKDRAAFNELETFLRKRGIWASNDVESRKRELKEGEYREILLAAAAAHRRPVELYESFFELLQKCLIAALNILETIASGCFHSLEKDSKKSKIDAIANLAFSKVPLVGSGVSSFYNSLREGQRVAEAGKLHKKLPVDIPAAVKDFAIRVVRQFAEEICSPVRRSALQELSKFISDKMKQVFKDDAKTYVFGGTDYTFDWGLLCHTYVSKFLDFLRTEEANSCSATIGIQAAVHTFEYHAVTRSDLAAVQLTRYFNHKNCLLFLRLTSFLSQIASYPSFLASSPDTFWCDTDIQSDKVNIKAQAFVTADKDKIIIAFLAGGNQVDTKCKDGKDFEGITISKQIHKCFSNFLDYATFFRVDSEKSFCFDKVLDLVLEKYKQATVFTTGFQLGATFSSLACLMVAKHEQAGKLKPVAYNFDEVALFHRGSLEKVFDIFTHYNQIKILKSDNVNFDPQKDQGFIHLRQNFISSNQVQQEQTVRGYFKIMADKYSNKSQSQIQKQSKNTDNQQMQGDLEPLTNIQQFSAIEPTLKILCEAAKSGNYKLVRFLVEVKKINPRQVLQDISVSSYATTALMEALIALHYRTFKKQTEQQYEDRIKIIKYLTEKGSDLNFKGRHIDNDTILLVYALKKMYDYQLILKNAILSRNVELIKYLVSKGMNLYGQFSDGLDNATALTWATKTENLEIVRYLVEEKGFSVNGLNFSYENNSITMYLLNKGISINSKQTRLGAVVTNIVTTAVDQENYDLVKFLAEKGADLNVLTGSHDGTTLHCATKKLNLRMVKLLLEHGADINIQNKSFASLLQFDMEAREKTPLDELKRNFLYQPEVSNYAFILALQGKMPSVELSFTHYEEVFKSILRTMPMFTVLSFFVSQFIYSENLINKKQVIEQNQNAKNVIEKAKKEFFEGNHRIQIYNRALRHLYMYSDPARFEKALAICQQFPQDDQFLFLEGIVYTQMAVGVSVDKKNYFKDKICNILSKMRQSEQHMYLRGQMLMLVERYNLAYKWYTAAIQKNKYFYHPLVKKVKLTLEKADQIDVPEDEKVGSRNFNSNIKQLSKKILPIDLEPVMEDVHELLETDSFLRKKAPPAEQQTFEKALRGVFTVDVVYLKELLIKIIPEKVYKIELSVQDKTEKITISAKKIINNIDYAYQILQTFGSGAFSKVFKSTGLPEHRNHDFFKKLSKLIQMLKSLRETVENKCTKRDFGSAKDYKICLNALSDLVEYYEEYIARVIDLYQTDRDRGFANNFFAGKGKELDIKQSIKVYLEQPLLSAQEQTEERHAVEMPYLLRRFASHSLTIAPPKSDQIYGTHSVVILPETGRNQAYYKFEPYAPGVEFAVSSLYRLILPNTTPETLLVKLVSGEQSGLYLASKAITGRNFAEVINQGEVIRAIDMKNFSSLFLSSFLVCTGDSKPDNFVMHFNYDSRGLVSTELISIDNDIAFYRSRLQVNAEQKMYSDMLNILYLMPQMEEPVSPYLRDYLVKQENQPEVIVAKWLSDLHRKNQQYAQMQGFTPEDLRKLKLPIKLPAGTAAKVYSILRKITALLQSESVTHAQIFEALSPSLAYFYNKQRDSTSMINSLKNIYIAAGAHPELVSSLYNFNKIVSSKAWNTLSASKRRNNEDFGRLFSSDIAVEAEHFIGCIGFEGKNEFVVNAIREHLSFVGKVTLRNALEWQFAEFKKTFPSVQMREERTNLTAESSPEPSKPSAPLLNIASIWDLLQLKELPSNDALMGSLLTKAIDINEANTDSETVLFAAVRQAKQNPKQTQQLIRLLLDCGINAKKWNNDQKTALDIADQQSQKIPQTILLILEHQPTYLRRLIRGGRLQEAEVIARSMNSESCLQTIDSENRDEEGRETSVLRELVSNRKNKHLLMIALSKMESKAFLHQSDILHLFVENYSDSDFDALDLVLLHFKDVEKSRRSLPSFCKSVCDTAFVSKKPNLLVRLLNSGYQLSESILIGNIEIVSIASEYKIKIDLSDVVQHYDYNKGSQQGKTVFHLMALAKDMRLLTFTTSLNEAIQRYMNDFKKIALDNDFIELIQVLFTEEELERQIEGDSQLLIKSESDRELARLLKKNGFSISISDARRGIDLCRKVDQRRNTLLTKLVLDHITNNSILKPQIMHDIRILLGRCQPSFVNFTLRQDGNTALHLAARAASSELVCVLLMQKSIEECIFNAQGKKPVDLAMSEEVKGLFKAEDVQLNDILKRIGDNLPAKKENKLHSVQSTAFSMESIKNWKHVM